MRLLFLFSSDICSTFNHLLSFTESPCLQKLLQKKLLQRQLQKRLQSRRQSRLQRQSLSPSQSRLKRAAPERSSNPSTREKSVKSLLPKTKKMPKRQQSQDQSQRWHPQRQKHPTQLARGTVRGKILLPQLLCLPVLPTKPNSQWRTVPILRT